MKKAKFVLGAIAALGIVGSVFAFKAARTTERLFIKSTPTATQCLSTINGFTLTTTLTNVPATTLPTYVTTAPGACPVRTYYYTGE